jgi:hypothetical protein
MLFRLSCNRKHKARTGFPAMTDPESRTSEALVRATGLQLTIEVSALLCLLASGAELSAAENESAVPRPVAHAVRIPDEMSIRVDGSLTDAAWALASPISEFRQQEPAEGGVPSERTEIRIVYDSRALYIGAMMYDSEPGGILAHQLQRNAGLGSDDRFMWILDTFGDGRTGYFFETNPAGLLGDGLIESGGNPNKRWDGIWDVRTQILPDGWSVEIRIPFSTLNFDPAREAWGINFQRTIRRRNEEILWSGWRRTEGLFRPAHAGQLRGIANVSQGVGVELKPYVVAATNRDASASATDNVKAGLDINYSITPSLRAAITLNTDFAEVEVDQRRVNITRFPLRFPEQREFFLEGSGVFSFRWADPFFSRRIGLVDGQEVPIRYGARLGGQVGRYELGVYQVRTGDTTLTAQDGSTRPWAAEDFTVARVKRALFEQSHVGAIYTRRSSGEVPGEPRLADRHTLGADFDFYTSQLFGRYNGQVEGFMLYHSDPIEGRNLGSTRRRARGYRLAFPNDLIRLHTSYRDFSDEWDPAVGFADRRGFRRHQPTLTVAPRHDSWARIRQTEHQIYFEYLTDMERRLLTRNLNFTFVQVNFESGDRLWLQGGENFERLERNFAIYGTGDDAIRIEPGDYDSRRWTVGAQSASRRMVSGRVNFESGDFWGGHRDQLQLSGTIQPRSGISFSADYERNAVSLPQGDFDTNLVRLTWAWNLNPLASITGSVQYDDVTNIVGFFARARWIVRPGTDIFVVWSHNWRYDDDPLRDRRYASLSRSAAVKANYTFRF